MFKPADLHIAHIFIYAVAPQYARHCQLVQTRAIPQEDTCAARVIGRPAYEPLAKCGASVAVESARGRRTGTRWWVSA
eukprot:7286005-Lingulodinium_polyedra.AAC.1